MRRIVLINLILSTIIVNADDNLHSMDNKKFLAADSVIIDNSVLSETKKSKNIYEERLRVLNNNTPMDLAYNDKVKPFIDNYLGRNKVLISRMIGLSLYYFLYLNNNWINTIYL